MQKKEMFRKRILTYYSRYVIKTKLKDVKIKTNSTSSTGDYKKTRNKMLLKFKETVTVC